MKEGTGKIDLHDRNSIDGKGDRLAVETAPTNASDGPARPLRARAFVLGLVFAVAICLVTPVNNAYHQGTPLGGGHFPLAPFFIVAWLTVAVGILARFRGGRAVLTGRELLVVWILMVLVSGIAYTGLVRTFFINLTAPLRFASPENRWGEILQPLLPPAWYPGDPAAVAGLYDGLEGGRQMSWPTVVSPAFPGTAWMPCRWPPGAVFVLLCYMVMLCLVGHPQSAMALANERMNFPLLRVPQLMSRMRWTSGAVSSFLERPLPALAGMAAAGSRCTC